MTFSLKRLERWINGPSYPGGELFRPQLLRKRPRYENEAIIRRLCSSVYIGEKTILARVLGRYKMFLDSADVGLSAHLMLDGYWEMWLTETLAEYIKPNMVVADIGANLGYFTLLMADMVGEQGHVHAFEPNPAIAARLRKSADLNGFRERTTIHQIALGSVDDDNVWLSITPDEPKNAHVTRDSNAPGLISVSGRRLDGLEKIDRLDIIKIDAEAAEYDIWLGMSGLLERQDHPLTIFLEFSSIRYAEPREFLDNIVHHGFDLAEVTFEHGVIHRTVSDILAAPPLIDQMLLLSR